MKLLPLLYSGIQNGPGEPPEWYKLSQYQTVEYVSDKNSDLDGPAVVQVDGYRIERIPGNNALIRGLPEHLARNLVWIKNYVAPSRQCSLGTAIRKYYQPAAAGVTTEIWLLLFTHLFPIFIHSSIR